MTATTAITARIDCGGNLTPTATTFRCGGGGCYRDRSTGTAMTNGDDLPNSEARRGRKDHPPGRESP